MLWIEKYRPKSLSDVVGQEQVVRHLHRFAAEGNLPHLLVAGPHGAGKSAAMECLARALYGDTWAENTTILPCTDLFLQGKGYLEADDRFSHLYRKDEGLSANVRRIVKWYASLRPLDAGFKILILEGAHSLPRETQQALRRIMERFSATCRFVFCTTNPSAVIPALASRCLPLTFPPLGKEVVLRVLRKILQEEVPAGGRDLTEEVELVVHMADGDLRKATMLLQLLVESGRGAGAAEIASSEAGTVALQAVVAMRSRDFAKAQRTCESLLVDYGLSGREALREIQRAVRKEYNDPRIAGILGDTDHALGHAGSEFIQLNAMIARVIREVFP